MPMTENGTIPAVIYAAKSTEDEHGSIPSQTAAVREAIEHEDGRVIVGEYSDEAVSAFKRSRGPGLAAAIDAAEHAAGEHGGAELWVFDPDRLARGDGKRARHLAGLYFDLLAEDVTLRAVQGDDDLKDAIRVVLRGERNNQDSAAKSGHTERGIAACVQRGEWRGGSLPEGYRAIRDIDERGRVIRTYAKCPERGPIIELIWHLALEGRSLQAIALECSKRHYQTAPKRTGSKPRPFDVNRVAQILRCPVYCGLQQHKGETVPINDWPSFVSIEDFVSVQFLGGLAE